MSRIQIFLIFVLALTAAACTSSSSGDPTSTATSICGELPAASLDDVFASYFSATPSAGGTGCAVKGCHADGAGGLEFRNAAGFYAVTVGVTSAENPNLAYVHPNKPESSFLYLRIASADDGARMPLGGPYLDNVALAKVAGWICAGAPPPTTVSDAGADGSVQGDAGTDGALAVTCDGGGRLCNDGTCIPSSGCCTDTDCMAPQTCGGGGESHVCGCTPGTCDSLQKNCGSMSDGCGGTLSCGTCSAPETCGGDGTPNVCGCIPTTCAALGKNCGTVPDGCGGTLSCGSCMNGETCGGTGTANVCGVGTCTPTTCDAQGNNCGTISDGCGSILDCGMCTSPETCGGTGTVNVCGCTPTSCAAQNKNCGTISDGCGNTLDCGMCTSPQSCGGGAIANVCGCTPTSCAAQGIECGTIPNGCGSTLNCASCSAGETCSSANTCVCGPSVSFASQVQPIFTAKCATMGCHTGLVPQQGLDLSSGKAYAELVNVASSECSGRTRVVPGDVANSYLINKITGVNMCPNTTKMPKTGSLSSTQIDTIAAWVCNGAPNN